MSAERLLATVERKLAATNAPAPTAELVRSAFAGEVGIDELLGEGVIAERAEPGTTSRAPVGAYITSVEVEGFRGIGERARLDLTPGPGLTLVIGRNGSGKSSFAEALEVLFTGDNPRWSDRTAVWKEGWRNLHHPTAEIAATLSVEGIPGPTVVRRSWADDGGLEDSSAEVQPHALPKAELDFLGWREALPMYRPFLSYSELGSMLDEGPTKLHDAVSSVLGLDELTAAEKSLRTVRLGREKAVNEALAQRDQVVSLLSDMEDARAKECVALLTGKAPALDPVERIVTDGTTGRSDGDVHLLRRVMGTEPLDADRIVAAAAEIGAAHAAVQELAGTEADAMLRIADLLEQAVAYVARFSTEDCPVCATPGALAGDWASRARTQIEEQRAAAHLAQRESNRLAAAVRAAHGFIDAVPNAIREARSLLDTTELVAAWGPWVELADERDPLRLAEGIEGTVAPLVEAMSHLQAAAAAEVDRREDAWRPVASSVAAWISFARPAFAAASRVEDLRKAESWLKTAAVEIRNDRFAPIADQSMEIWRLLRQQSNVSLGRIELKGSGTQRKVTLDVTVDGVPGAALGVMSQGELHALALSLFFPRATLDESPFRFVVVDDPVQSMDPAKVDGLAKVLEQAAQARQVVVFTHDDRLPEAVRRLQIKATVIEVSRREASAVELRPAMSPVERNIEDARALLRSRELPDEVKRRVVGGYCRLAIESACIETVRRRRIGRGEAHADVERVLAEASRFTVLGSLALFDDAERGGDVLGRLNSAYGHRSADAFQRVNKGAHQPVEGDLEDLVRDSAVLARELASSA